MGLLFEVKRGAVHDGPGWRTTAFFKGCPLSCPWCHNPEGISSEKEIWFVASRCVGCQNCVSVCPRGVPAPAAGQLGPAYGSACTVCGRCVDGCPVGSRAIVGMERTAEQLVQELARDRAFFARSGGGVTISGGEPLSQLDFLLEVLSACRKAGLNTALDTSGYAPRRDFLQAAALCDLVLFDLKHLDESRHEETTGVPLTPILENLHALDEEGANLWIRYPLIPGFNDDQSTLSRLADLVLRLRSKPLVCLLPYHRAGQEKYARLGRSDPMGDTEAPGETSVENVATRLANSGLMVRIGG